MTGKGTPGGQLRIDGSEIEAGIHLRWQMAPELGFPPGGFNIFRRKENYKEYLRCGAVIATDLGGAVWSAEDPDEDTSDFSILPSGETRTVEVCGPHQFTALFVGNQEVRLQFDRPARYIRIIFSDQTSSRPFAEAYWQTSEGDVLTAKAAAREKNGRFGLQLFADRIDHAILYGENMIVCRLCFVFVQDGYDADWGEPLNGDAPIYLPITHPDWYAPHPRSPDDQAEAEARLPAALDAAKQEDYAIGFRDELHAILYDLAGTESHHLYRLQESDEDSGATIDWSGMSLLQLMALDPNIARILGLYWHDDSPSPRRFYDYRVVGYYEDTHFPGEHVHFSDLIPGTRFESSCKTQGVTFVSPNPIDVVQASWDGSEHTALLFSRTIQFAPISIQLPSGVESVTLRLTAAAAFTVKVYFNNYLYYTRLKLAGDHTLHFDYGKSTNKILIFPLGDLTLVEMILRKKIKGIGDLAYDIYHIRVRGGDVSYSSHLEPPLAESLATGIDHNGLLTPHQSRVGLRWERHEAGGTRLLAGAPVQYHVRRDELDEDGAAVHSEILNEDKPAIVSRREDQSNAQTRPYYSDMAVPDGRYAYSVRGIDIFGVLGAWSGPQDIEVLDRRPPPPPQSVSAAYLDPEDPFLSDDDRDWAESHGPGLKISWEWPGLFRLQAPDVIPPAGEFRIYGQPGELNALRGSVIHVYINGATSELVTNMPWPGAPDALIGESIRVNQHFFSIVANTSGENSTIVVDNLTQPDLSPAPGPCSITFSPDSAYRKDYGLARNWQRRIHAEPAAETPILTAAVTSIEDYDEERYESDIDENNPDPELLNTTIARRGAARTITLDQPFDDEDGALTPGVLFCEGRVYRAYGHTKGERLKLHIVPGANPTDSTETIEPALDASCEYYPGRRYEIKLADFSLNIPPNEASASVHIAMSSTDGHAHTPDAVVWSRPGRGGLGGRPGNESPLSPAVKIMAVHRSQPDPVTNLPEPADPVFAEPADYYGMARYTLSWDSVSGVSGYAVYRCSGAMLFDTDRKQRELQKGPYQSGSVFWDDAGFTAWLADFDPTLSEADFLADPDANREAWRAWAARFYPSRTDTQLQDIAGRDGNEAAFRRLNPEVTPTASYDDVFDGRGQGFYLYRVRTVDAAGNLSVWSDAFPPVHIFDVTPPATPVVTSVLGGERRITLRWRANRENDLAEYRLWWSQSPEDLDDVRRLPPDAILAPAAEAIEESHEISGLTGGTTLYIRMAGTDRNGNTSSPTALLTGRAVDTTTPNPPVWISAAWNATGLAIDLQWLLENAATEVLVQRRKADSPPWIPASPWLEAGTQSFADTEVRASEAYSYRLLVRNDSGLLNDEFVIQAVAAIT